MTAFQLKPKPASGMSYSQFTLASVKRAFSLQTQESRDIFANTPSVGISDWLKQTYDYGLDVALETEIL